MNQDKITSTNTKESKNLRENKSTMHTDIRITLLRGQAQGIQDMLNYQTDFL